MADTRNQKHVTATPLVRRAVQLALVTAVAAGGSTALYAQEAPASSQNEPELQEVIVTGSMIKRANAETAEAITIMKADALKDQGIVNVEQAIGTLTSNTPAVNVATSVGTFSGGGSYANLRGLGDGRTLVLLDGQRLANNAFSGNAVDLSGIPFSAIDSVEVLREGASALYGSDAIAGVINFKTKQNYQGLEFQANFDRPQHDGGGSGEADFTFGHGDIKSDGYNFMITGSYTKQQELQATQRAFSAYGLDPSRGVTATNFPGSWPGNFLDSNGNLWQSGYPACAGNPQLSTANGGCDYRYSAATDLLPKSSVLSGMASFTKALPGNNQVQLQYFYTQSEVTAYSGPMFYWFTMDPASPYYPKASQLSCYGGAANCSTPVPDLADGGDAIWTDPDNSRYNGNLNVEQRVLLTFSGNNAGWDYAANFNWSRNNNDGRNLGGYPNEDVLAPGGVLSDLINPFGPQSAAGQALIDSSYINGVYQLGSDSRWSTGGHVSHDLIDFFNAGTPATAAFGVDVGGERFAYHTTPYNDLVIAATGLTDSAVAGSRQTQAAFLELDVPILKNLDLDASDREDRYSDFGKTNNWKAQLRYQPFSFLTLRGTASTGFRAPTLYSLYLPPNLSAASSASMGQGNPYCATNPPTAPFTALTCGAQGVGLYGGNIHLQPEKSQNYDFGVVLSPLPDLGITVDYYRILVQNTISSVPSSAIYGDPAQFASYYVLNNTGGLTTTAGEAAACTPYTAPTCGYILRNSANTGRLSTNGIDVSIQYVQHTQIGTFREDLEGTAVTQYLDQVYTGGPIDNLVGYAQLSEQNPAFRWQHNIRVDWTSPNGMWGGGVSNRFYSRYLDEYGNDGSTSNPRMVGNYSLVDGYLSYKPIESLTVLFGIKNLFDKNPPFTNAAQNNFAAGYNAIIADPLGRNFYVNLKYKVY